MPRLVTKGLVMPYGYGEAYVDYVNIATPAAGAQVSVSIEGQWYVRVLAARATFTPDANVASRLVSLDYVNGRGVTFVRNAPSALIAASAGAQAYEWQANRSVSEWNTGTPVWVPLAPLFLEPGFVVKFAVDSIQVGDALTALSLVVEKWPTGPRGVPQGVVVDIDSTP